MPITAELIEKLLWESESTSLDFKIDQYPFATATDDQKSEIVKDILAFANAFTRADAYILIGVKEAKGGRGEIVGVTEQLEDAHLQQLVHGCIKRHLEFSYQAISFEGKSLGIIHIPRQKRPFYPAKNFGHLKKGEVYFRRGSSTAVASPDEIAAMGSDQIAASPEEPQLQFSLYDRETGTMLGAIGSFDHEILEGIDLNAIPDYEESYSAYSALSLVRARKEYYRELVVYTLLTHNARRLSLAIKNIGEVTANGVRLHVEAEKKAPLHFFLNESDIPDPPKSHTDPFPMAQMASFSHRSDMNLEIQKFPNSWKINCDFGKIQAQATEVIDEDLYFGVSDSGTITLTLKIYADNLRKPLEATCQLQSKVERRTVDLEAIESIEAARFRKTPKGRELWGDEEDDGE